MGLQVPSHSVGGTALPAPQAIATLARASSELLAGGTCPASSAFARSRLSSCCTIGLSWRSCWGPRAAACAALASPLPAVGTEPVCPAPCPSSSIAISGPQSPHGVGPAQGLSGHLMPRFGAGQGRAACKHTRAWRAAAAWPEAERSPPSPHSSACLRSALPGSAPTCTKRPRKHVALCCRRRLGAGKPPGLHCCRRASLCHRSTQLLLLLLQALRAVAPHGGGRHGSVPRLGAALGQGQHLLAPARGVLDDAVDHLAPPAGDAGWVFGWGRPLSAGVRDGVPLRARLFAPRQQAARALAACLFAAR